MMFLDEVNAQNIGVEDLIRQLLYHAQGIDIGNCIVDQVELRDCFYFSTNFRYRQTSCDAVTAAVSKENGQLLEDNRLEAAGIRACSLLESLNNCSFSLRDYLEDHYKTSNLIPGK